MRGGCAGSAELPNASNLLYPGLGHHLEEETTVAIDGQIHETAYFQPIRPGSACPPAKNARARYLIILEAGWTNSLRDRTGN